MQIDTAILGVLITVVMALLVFASWVGALHQKVKNIDTDLCELNKEFKSYQIENKADHIALGIKLDRIINGKGSR